MTVPLPFVTLFNLFVFASITSAYLIIFWSSAVVSGILCSFSVVWNTFFCFLQVSLRLCFEWFCLQCECPCAIDVAMSCVSVLQMSRFVIVFSLRSVLFFCKLYFYLWFYCLDLCLCDEWLVCWGVWFEWWWWNLQEIESLVTWRLIFFYPFTDVTCYC